MRKEIKISLLSLVCGLSVITFGSAFAAPAVRSLGGAGTYSGVSSAAAAKTTANTNSGSSAVKSVRANTVRSTAAGLGSIKPTASTRTSATPRLSIGKYLGGAVSSNTISKGDGATLAGDIDDLQGQLESLIVQMTALQGDFVNASQTTDFVSTSGTPGKDNFALTLDVDKLIDEIKVDLEESGFGVEMQYDASTGMVQYKDANGNWVDLVEVGTNASLVDMAEDLAELEARLNALDIPDISGLATKVELAGVEAKIPSIDGLATKDELATGLSDVEGVLGDGALLTGAKTIIGAINEIKTTADNALTDENLTGVNTSIAALQGVVGSAAAGETPASGLVGEVGALTQSLSAVENDLDAVSVKLNSAIMNPGDCSAAGGVCVLGYQNGEYNWFELTTVSTGK